MMIRLVLRYREYYANHGLVRDQEFMDELRQLLMVARHPRTLKLLQDAIKQVDRPSSVTTGKIPGKVNGVSKEGHGSDVTGRVSGHSKSSPYGPTTRIKDYGE